MRKSQMLLATFLVVAVQGCTAPSPDPSPESAGTPTGPDGTAFYTPPPGADPKPGKLIWTRPISTPGGVKGDAILYWSTSVSGEPAPVSGVVYRSAAEPPDPAPIVSWAHGTVGLGDKCAPSKTLSGNQDPNSNLVQQVLGVGAVYVATDYEGLGTPGEHPYAVGIAAGHNVLDAIRAAAELTGAKSPRALALGQSQGGSAALFAAELAAEYAPEVELAGAVAVAPPSQLDRMRVDLDGGKHVGYALMAIAGMQAAYPDLADDSASLSSKGKKAVEQVRSLCGQEILGAHEGARYKDLGLRRFLADDDFRKRLRENEPGRGATDVPIFIVQGEADDLVPAESSRQLLDGYCGLDVTAIGGFYPGATHTGVFQDAGNDIATYVTDRLAGKPAPSGCD